MVDNNDSNKKPIDPQKKNHPTSPNGVKKVVKKKKKISSGEKQKERPKTHRNAILFLIAIVLFAYAGFLSIFPTILKATFNKEVFAEKIQKTTGLITSIDDIDFKLEPSFNLLITINNWVSNHTADQECFSAKRIELKTNPFCMFTKNFVIKDMEIKSVKYFDQVYENGENKLDYLSNINFSQFNANKVTITSGPVNVRNFKITYIEPDRHRENNRDVVKYNKADVKAFLQSRNFENVIVK